MNEEKVTMASLPASELNRLTAIEEGLEELISNSDDTSVDMDDLSNLLKRG